MEKTRIKRKVEPERDYLQEMRVQPIYNSTRFPGYNHATGQLDPVYGRSVKAVSLGQYSIAKL